MHTCTLHNLELPVIPEYYSILVPNKLPVQYVWVPKRESKHQGWFMSAVQCQQLKAGVLCSIHNYYCLLALTGYGCCVLMFYSRI